MNTGRVQLGYKKLAFLKDHQATYITHEPLTTVTIIQWMLLRQGPEALWIRT